jgi:signal transduction histidine kinase
MYGEILREGWASEEKKKRYYDYIHDESERLSRLISNVLQLARMTHNDLQVDLTPMHTMELIDAIRPKVSSLAERAGFALQWQCEDEAAQSIIPIDLDYFTQILINLLDNAIKFSRRAERKEIVIGCRLLADGSILFSVRDYGPGIAKNQMKKVFKLFYRTENELTRETLGTGIGLALVQQLTSAMHGTVDVVNTSPGAEFRLLFHPADPEIPLDPLC